MSASIALSPPPPPSSLCGPGFQPPAPSSSLSVSPTGRRKPPNQHLGANASSIEEQIRTSYFTPSPVWYNPRRPERFEACPLSKFSESLCPSALDEPVRLKGFVPGPGSYET